MERNKKKNTNVGGDQQQQPFVRDEFGTIHQLGEDGMYFVPIGDGSIPTSSSSSDLAQNSQRSSGMKNTNSKTDLTENMNEGLNAYRGARDHRHKKILRILKKAKKEVIIWLKDDILPWKEVDFTKSKDIKLYECQQEDGCYLLKATGPIWHWDLGEFIKMQMDTNMNTRLNWDTDLSDIRIVEQLKPAMIPTPYQPSFGSHSTTMPAMASVSYFKVALPKAVSLLSLGQLWPRDVMCAQHWAIRKKGDVLIISQSIDNPYKTVEKSRQEGFIRATQTSVMYIKPIKGTGNEDEPTLMLTMAARVYPNGWIPASVLGFYKERLAERITYFTQCHFLSKTKSEKN